MSERPTCVNEGCNGKAHLIRYDKKTGKPSWRRYCGPCHGLVIAKRAGFDSVIEYQNDRLTKIAEEKGFESLTAYKNHLLLQTARANGFETITEYKNYQALKLAKENGFETIAEYKNHQLQKLAKAKGFETITEYLNSKHPYRKHRKDYCENIDGRLGYECTAKIVWSGQLDVDHIDGNPTNQTEENLQTLCKNCHSYKTMINEDYRSTGRTTYRKKGVAVYS